MMREFFVVLLFIGFVVAVGQLPGAGKGPRSRPDCIRATGE